VLLSAEQERQFFEACDEWQFPVFLTLILTGVRPGELAHLLLPDDLDPYAGVLRVRNKPKLGWQVKTRSEREVPLTRELAQVLRTAIGGRASGPVFIRPGLITPLLETQAQLEAKLHDRVIQQQKRTGSLMSRQEQSKLAKVLWWETGAVREDRIRVEFMRVAQKIGLPDLTMPKALRHQFATALQDATSIHSFVTNSWATLLRAAAGDDGCLHAHSCRNGATAAAVGTGPSARHSSGPGMLAKRVKIAATQEAA